jgi:hypothetical protein
MQRFNALPTRSSPAATTRQATGARALIHVSWDHSPDLQEFLRFVNAYARGRFSNSMAERLTLATNELLDNALRYGSLAREFSYRLDIDSAHIAVTVKNSTVQTRIDMLAAQLKRLETTPEQVYASELERSATSGGRRSMLGLARIRHEAEMQLELTLDGQDVSLRAFCPR